MSDTPIEISIQPDGIPAVAGSLTFATVSAAAQTRPEFLRSAGAGDITVDLSRVDHLDSAGLALLVRWLGDAANQGRELRFCGASDQTLALAGIAGVKASFA